MCSVACRGGGRALGQAVYSLPRRKSLLALRSRNLPIRLCVERQSRSGPPGHTRRPQCVQEALRFSVGVSPVFQAGSRPRPHRERVRLRESPKGALKILGRAHLFHRAGAGPQQGA
ncbi:hypothetical protein NDU88_001915 [Pleurodeles waltl]|uniref:Uncharacterized protein n=1 Tax=Pleurodeles waltl TaxID=8319 RepID=A0AAV7U8B9_PLEWA|nr:hypothetical protein NDU88_001915 [Pleurodeles waltl]